jgi:hypothetical protein
MVRRVAAWLLHGLALAAGLPGAGLLLVATWAEDTSARLSNREPLR